MSRGDGVVACYGRYLPLDPDGPVVSLGEGGTPLLRSERLSAATGADVWLKYEGLNPTGSFKDRGMTVAVSKAVQDGARAVVCASTGNTSASAAAYASRAGLRCGVLIPRGNVALGKVAQAVMHGARVLEVDANFDEALVLTKQLAEDDSIALVNSINPFRLEGQKTGAFEVVEALGGSPDLHLMPVGNAGNITAYWRGYREARDHGWSGSLPRMHGFQAAGAAPIVRGEVVKDPQTRATAIRIGNPASWATAVEAVTETGGGIEAVTDDEMLDCYQGLAREGVFVELASAASVAGLMKMHERGEIPARATVVCVLTGHGLKDPDLALSAADRARPTPPTQEAVLSALRLDA